MRILWGDAGFSVGHAGYIELIEMGANIVKELQIISRPLQRRCVVKAVKL